MATRARALYSRSSNRGRGILDQLLETPSPADLLLLNKPVRTTKETVVLTPPPPIGGRQARAQTRRPESVIVRQAITSSSQPKAMEAPAIAVAPTTPLDIRPPTTVASPSATTGPIRAGLQSFRDNHPWLGEHQNALLQMAAGLLNGPMEPLGRGFAGYAAGLEQDRTLATEEAQTRARNEAMTAFIREHPELTPADIAQLQSNPDLVDQLMATDLGNRMFPESTDPSQYITEINGQLVDIRDGSVIGDYRDVSGSSVARRLTTQEVDAQHLDPSRVWQLNADGTLDDIGPSDQQVADVSSAAQRDTITRRNPDDGQDHIYSWNDQTARFDIDQGLAPERSPMAYPPASPFASRLGTLSADKLDSAHTDALTSTNTLDTLAEQRRLLDQGIIAGSAANPILFLSNLAITMGIADPSSQDAVANTQAYMANLATLVADIITQFGAGTGLSDADRQYALNAAGGNIEMTEDALRRILLIHERAAHYKIARYNEMVDSAPQEDLAHLPDLHVRESTPAPLPDQTNTPPEMLGSGTWRIQGWRAENTTTHDIMDWNPVIMQWEPRQPLVPGSLVQPPIPPGGVEIAPGVRRMP